MSKSMLEIKNFVLNNMGNSECMEIEKLESKIKILEDALGDFEKYGARHDINPTGQFRKCGCFDSVKGDHWQGYIRSQDSTVKERARQALKEAREL